MKKNRFDFFVFLFLLITTIILKYPTLNDPFYWDDLSIGSGIFKILNENASLLDENNSHPPFFHASLGLISKVAGFKLAIFHLFVILIGTIGLFYFYKLAEHIFNSRKIAIFSSMVLLFIPPYFSSLGRIYFEIPLSTFGIMCIYFLFKNKYLPFSLSLLLGLFTKESFLWIVPALALYPIFKYKKIDKKILISFGLPIFIFVIWGITQANIINNLSSLFEYYTRRELQFEFLKQQINNTLFNFSIIFLTLPTIFFLAYDLIKGKLNAEFKTLTAIFLTYFIVIMIFYSYIRYALLFYPALILLFFNGIKRITNLKIKIEILIVLLILGFVSSYDISVSSTCGCDLEANLNYRESMKVYQLSLEYVEQMYPEKIILTTWPFNHMLANPQLGYVTKPIPTITLPNINYDLIIFSSQITIDGQYDLKEFIKKETSNNKIILSKEFRIKDKYVQIYESTK